MYCLFCVLCIDNEVGCILDPLLWYPNVTKSELFVVDNTPRIGRIWFWWSCPIVSIACLANISAFVLKLHRLSLLTFRRRLKTYLFNPPGYLSP